MATWDPGHNWKKATAAYTELLCVAANVSFLVITYFIDSNS